MGSFLKNMDFFGKLKLWLVLINILGQSIWLIQTTNLLMHSMSIKLKFQGENTRNISINMGYFW